MIRQPAVAGTFYPREPSELLARVQQFLKEGRAENPVDSAAHVLACLVPHAGYVFSGGVAGAVYARIKIPKRVVILGPRHRPGGANFAINSEGAWKLRWAAPKLILNFRAR